MQLDFYHFNATTIKIDELRTVFKRYENSLLKPLIFIDEVHRLSKNQQEVLLPVMENYSVIIIGASTEYHWCGIKHNQSKEFREPNYQKEFIKYGNENQYKKTNQKNKK